MIFASNEEHRDLEIACFLKVAQSYIVKVCKELEVIDMDSTAIVKCKMHAKGPNTIRTPKFICKMQRTINKNHRKLIDAIAKKLKVSRYSISIIVHESLQVICDVEKPIHVFKGKR